MFFKQFKYNFFLQYISSDDIIYLKEIIEEYD